MPTTSNFGWTTPADTDLVKDGAAAIRTLGSGIDTSFVDLKGGTTGQNLRKNSNTDLDFTWAGDATNTVVDAAGDLLYGTAADTLGRLAIGTANQVLAVNAGATAPEWKTLAAGGGWTELASGSLTGSSVSITSISQDYRQLALYCRDYYPSADDTFAIRVNSTSSIYGVSYSRDSGGITDTKLPFFLQENMDAADNDAFAVMFFDDYTNTNTFKTTRANALQRKADNSNYLYGWCQGVIRTTSAISSIQIEYLSGSNHSGGTYILYGVR